MGGLQKHCTTAPPDLARLQVGSYPYLKNFRKGLQHQRERCLRELRAAIEADDAARAADCNDCFLWIRQSSIGWTRVDGAPLRSGASWEGKILPPSAFPAFSRISRHTHPSSLRSHFGSRLVPFLGALTVTWPAESLTGYGRAHF